MFIDTFISDSDDVDGREPSLRTSSMTVFLLDYPYDDDDSSSISKDDDDQH
jgi:hypothetical protein